MQINVTGHHIEVTDSLHDYIKNKFERLERHFDKVTNINVILNVEKLDQKAEATLNLKGNKIFAEAVNADMYASIDALLDKLDRQICKHKEKITDHHRSEGSIRKQEQFEDQI